MRKILFAALSFFLVLTSYGQTYEWAKGWGATSSDYTYDMVRDQNGHLYCAGGFEGSGDFDPGPGNLPLTAVGVSSVYLSKFSPTGNLIWAKLITGAEIESVQGICVDLSGNLYVTIRNTSINSIDYDPGAAVVNLPAGGMALCKYSPTGDLLWVKQYGGLAAAITLDAVGNILITGGFSGSADFDPSTNTATLSTSNIDDTDIFVSKYTPNGDFIWAKQFGGPLIQVAEAGYALHVNASGNIMVAGGFSGTADFDPGAGTSFLTSQGEEDAFLLQLTPSGDLLWVQGWGGPAIDNTTFVKSDGVGNYYVAGLYTEAATLGSIPLVSLGNGVEIFVAKLNASGSFLWAQSVGSPFFDNPYSFSVDNAGNSYFSGYHYPPMDLDPGAGQYFLPNAAGSNFLTKLSPSGNFIWSHGTQGGGNNAFVNIWATALDETEGSIYMLGDFGDSAYFDTGSASIHLVSAGMGSGAGDTYLAKFTQNDCSNFRIGIDSVTDIRCTNNTGLIAVHGEQGTAPYTYQWNVVPPVTDSVLAITSHGRYQVVVTDAAGCTQHTTFLLNGPSPMPDRASQLVATVFRPGFQTHIWLNAYNKSCQPANGQLKLVLDTALIYQNAVPAPSSIVNDTLIWDFTNQRYDTPPIAPQIYVSTPATVAIGDHMKLFVATTPVANDANATDNTRMYTFPVENGYDPNDKQVYPKGECVPGYIENDQLLTYTVRFQNTGNADAINIYIVDSLHPSLDLNSVRVVSKSHDMYTEVLAGNTLRFVFNNIHLPDSGNNEAQSHGYVVYEVNPLPGLPVGTVIENKAEIYFDFNPAVMTNTVHNTISDGNLGISQTTFTESACESYTLNGQTYYNSGTYTQTLSNTHGCDSTVTLHLTIHELAGSFLLQEACKSYVFNGQTYTQSGTFMQTFTASTGCDSVVTLSLTIVQPNTSVTQNGFTLTANATGTTYQWIDCGNQSPIAGATEATYSPTVNGSYAVIITQNGCSDTSACYTIAGMGISENGSKTEIQLYPNPAQEQITLQVSGGWQNSVLRMVNLTGQTVHTQIVSDQQTVLDVAEYAAGIYWMELTQNGKTRRIKWVKQ